MFKHHFTVYLILKSIICFVGYVACLVLGQPSDVLFTVTLLSAAFIPVFAYLEAQQ